MEVVSSTPLRRSGGGNLLGRGRRPPIWETFCLSLLWFAGYLTGHTWPFLQRIIRVTWYLRTTTHFSPLRAAANRSPTVSSAAHIGPIARSAGHYVVDGRAYRRDSRAGMNLIFVPLCLAHGGRKFPCRRGNHVPSLQSPTAFLCNFKTLEIPTFMPSISV